MTDPFKAIKIDRNALKKLEKKNTIYSLLNRLILNMGFKCALIPLLDFQPPSVYTHI